MAFPGRRAAQTTLGGEEKRRTWNGRAGGQPTDDADGDTPEEARLVLARRHASRRALVHNVVRQVLVKAGGGGPPEGAAVHGGAMHRAAASAIASLGRRGPHRSSVTATQQWFRAVAEMEPTTGPSAFADGCGGWGDLASAPALTGEGIEAKPAQKQKRKGASVAGGALTAGAEASSAETGPENGRAARATGPIESSLRGRAYRTGCTPHLFARPGKSGKRTCDPASAVPGRSAGTGIIRHADPLRGVVLLSLDLLSGKGKAVK